MAERDKVQKDSRQLDEWQRSARAAFKGHAFGKVADFYELIFPGEVDFRHATFSKDARFIRATFHGDALFADARSCRGPRSMK